MIFSYNTCPITSVNFLKSQNIPLQDEYESAYQYFFQRMNTEVHIHIFFKGINQIKK